MCVSYLDYQYIFEAGMLFFELRMYFLSPLEGLREIVSFFYKVLKLCILIPLIRIV